MTTTTQGTTVSMQVLRPFLFSYPDCSPDPHSGVHPCPLYFAIPVPISSAKVCHHPFLACFRAPFPSSHSRPDLSSEGMFSSSAPSFLRLPPHRLSLPSLLN